MFPHEVMDTIAGWGKRKAISGVFLEITEARCARSARVGVLGSCEAVPSLMASPSKKESLYVCGRLATIASAQVDVNILHD